jgi:hypothetical protein
MQRVAATGRALSADDAALGGMVTGNKRIGFCKDAKLAFEVCPYDVRRQRRERGEPEGRFLVLSLCAYRMCWASRSTLSKVRSQYGQQCFLAMMRPPMLFPRRRDCVNHLSRLLNEFYPWLRCAIIH